MAGIVVNPFAPDKDCSETLIYNPSVPLKHPMTIHPYRMVYISGMPDPECSRFTINFDCPKDLAFHFDVRMNYGGERNSVVRNASLDGIGWGEEIREKPFFPFEPNKFFEVVIMVNPTCYKVAVNNRYFVSFDHRIEDLSKVNVLRITGDVRLFQVRIL